MNYIDFHCHLDMDEFIDNRKELVEEYFAEGCPKLVTVADPYQADSLIRTKEILTYNENIYCMVAAHPHNADKYTPQIEKTIVNFISDANAVAVGEAGLDFHYNLSTPENQFKVFRRQINLAKDLRLPLLIHSRNAEQDVLKTLDEENFNFPVIFHCYTGNMEDAKEILARGHSISISGIVTFKKAQFLRDIAQMIPLSQIFTETDSPYLAPVPFRGNTNTPIKVKHVADLIAELKNIPIRDLTNAVEQNLKKLVETSY